MYFISGNACVFHSISEERVMLTRDLCNVDNTAWSGFSIRTIYKAYKYTVQYIVFSFRLKKSIQKHNALNFWITELFQRDDLKNTGWHTKERSI